MATPTPIQTTVKVKAGECIILPSNAVIVSASTFGLDPEINSTDCPDLAQAIEDKLEVAVVAYLKTMKSAGRNLTPAYNKVALYGMRINDKTYSFPEFEIENAGAYQSSINYVGLDNLIKVIGTQVKKRSNEGGQCIVTLKTFPSIIKDFTWFGYGTGVGNVESSEIEFRVDTTR